MIISEEFKIEVGGLRKDLGYKYLEILYYTEKYPNPIIDQKLHLIYS